MSGGSTLGSGLTLSILPDMLSICRLDAGAEIPPWAADAGFMSITRTADELSIVCPEEHVPEGVKREESRRALKVEGPLDFGMTGVLVSIAAPLAEAGIPILALGTYETDYILIREHDLEGAVEALSRHGHRVSR